MGKASKNTKIAKAEATTTEMTQNTKYDAVPNVKKELIEEHLPPIALVFAVVACSGFLFMFAFRDVFATGRNIGGDMDAAYLVSLRRPSWCFGLHFFLKPPNSSTCSNLQSPQCFLMIQMDGSRSREALVPFSM